MKYLVTMETIELGLIPPQQMAQLVEEVVIPSMEGLMKLEAEKKILAGGGFAGTRGGMAVVEAASNEELARLLKSIPIWGMMKTVVTPLQSFEEEAAQARQMVNQLKAAQQ
jgi:muconolactone delta-isomerase